MNFETDKNTTSICVIISFNNGKTSITCKSRLTAGEPLIVVSIDNISDDQLHAICNVLDELP